MTFKQDFNKKYNQPLNRANGLNDIAKLTKIKKSILQKVYRMSKEQWAIARVYGFVMGNKKQIGKGQPDRDLYALT